MQGAVRGFVDLYYEASPRAADFIARHELLRTLVREIVVDPKVTVLDTSKDFWSH